MTSEYDPLREPLRLLRETSLAAGFEERLAENLAAAHRQSNVVRFPGRKRALLLVAAIALPAAAAAAAGGYYVQQRTAASSPESTSKQLEAKPLVRLPGAGFTVNVPLAAPATPTIEALPAPRSQEPSRPSDSAPKAEERGASRTGSENAAPSPRANDAPRIEALDPFASKSTTSKQPTATPKGVDVRESLRRTTEQGAARATDDTVRGSRRDTNANENRGNDAAQQARERVQARERKGP